MICRVPNCGRKIHSFEYCDTHYRRWRKGKDTSPIAPIPGIQGRIQANSIVRENGCIEWLGGLTYEGYACICYNGIDWRVSRLLFVLRDGSIPRDKLACHTCDNPACINMAHLFLDSNDGNMKDAAEKKRMRHGERHHMSKVSDREIEELRVRKSKGESAKKLARDYGLALRSVYGITNYDRRTN